MKLEKMNLVELSYLEKSEINGGDNPFVTIWESGIKPAGKAVLGFLAGVGDGIRAGLND